MHKISRLAALLIAGAIVSAPALAAGKGEAPAAAFKVNGKAVPQNVADALMTEAKSQGAPDTAEVKNAVKEDLIRRELLTQEAVKKGLDKRADVAGQLALVRLGVLANAAIADYAAAHPVSDEQLKKDYEGIKAQLGGTEYKARHILVEKEQEAKDIVAKLDKGEKIEDLAKASKDPGSKDSGGDLGWSAPNAYVKPFSDAMKLLKKGEYTKTPVKTDYGYHVILLEDTRPLQTPPFEQVKPQLQQRAQKQLVEQYLKELRAKAKVE